MEQRKQAYSGSLGDYLLSLANNRRLIIILFLVFLVFPVYWSFRYSVLPIQDLPNHLAGVYILLHHHSSAFLQKYFDLHFNLFPYLLQDLLLSVFMAAGGVDFAGNLFVAVAVISIPLGLLYLISVINPQKTYLCFFSLPFVWNELLFKGNLNYILGLSLSLICLALLWKLIIHESRFDKKQWASLFLCGFLTYLAHIVSFVLLLFILLILVFYDLLRKRRYSVAVPVLAAGFLVTVNFLFISAGPKAYNPLSYASIAGKISDAGYLFRSSLPGEPGSLIPLIMALGFLALALTSIFRIKDEPLPFIICGMLILAYFTVPPELPPLVRPHQRVFYLLVFLSPLCCINRKHLAVEKAAVIILCTIIFIQARNHFTRIEDVCSPNLIQGRDLLRTLPEEKKLFYIWTYGTYVSHLGSYYVMDRNGYVPSQFSASYMIVRYRKKPPLNAATNTLEQRTLAMFDYLMIAGDDGPLRGFMNECNFKFARESGNFHLYENEYPSQEIQ